MHFIAIKLSMEWFGLELLFLPRWNNILHAEPCDKSPGFLRDDLSAWFWLFPFVLSEIIYSSQVCHGTTVSSKAKKYLSQNWKILPLKTGKSSEWRNLRNPRRAELQIRWKKILANPEPQSARLSSASSDWNHISWEMQRETDQNPVQIRKVLFLLQQIYISFSVRGAAREGNLGEVEWMNYVKQWKSFSSFRFVSVSSPQQEAGGYSL